jgi:hypothetical protein
MIVMLVPLIVVILPLVASMP